MRVAVETGSQLDRRWTASESAAHPSARPIVCNDSPCRHRRHNSLSYLSVAGPHPVGEAELAASTVTLGKISAFALLQGCTW
jgi:hypothetical protein